MTTSLKAADEKFRRGQHCYLLKVESFFKYFLLFVTCTIHQHQVAFLLLNGMFSINRWLALVSSDALELKTRRSYKCRSEFEICRTWIWLLSSPVYGSKGSSISPSWLIFQILLGANFLSSGGQCTFAWDLVPFAVRDSVNKYFY